MSCALHSLFAALLAPNADETTKLLKRILTMSESLNTKVGALTSKTDEMLVKLNQAEARDAVQAQTLASVRTEMEALKAELANNVPADTSVAEAAIDSVLAKLDAAEAQIDALDAAPVAVPTPVDTGAPVSPDAPANPDAPVNPNA